MTNQLFSERLLAWYDDYGRKNLPWQKGVTPYHIWLSEIMLQQTQVATVIPYYRKFVDYFPDIDTLANASVDDVLSHWSGLGYYARGRNLHKAAVQVQQKHNSQLPDDFVSLQALPGIGRSTAGAIMALAFHQRFPILDGNVKRVLARYDAINTWTGDKQTETRMWQRAEELLPATRIANYVQAQMDLGATVCTRSRPACHKCPLQTDCRAYASGQQTRLPVPKPKRAQPVRQTHWYIYKDKNNHILLEQRPQNGIWGGLWSFPESQAGHPDLKLPIKNPSMQYTMPEINHIFTHFKLIISPYIYKAEAINMVNEDNRFDWVRIDQALKLGLPAPVRQLIEHLLLKERTL